jgi:hypothetical protein
MEDKWLTKEAEKFAYEKDAQIKEDFKNTLRGESGRDINQGARLRMDDENQYSTKISNAYPVNETGPLETLEQERNRLSRKLTQTLSENENRIRVLRDMIESMERWQKNGYYLRDSINNSSQVQMDQIHQMREYLK